MALAFARLPEAQADRRRRRHLMEGSFAHAANRYHFKRARWRRLWRQQIQDWLIAAVQNIARLCGALGCGVAVTLPQRPKQGAAARRRPSARSRLSSTPRVLTLPTRFSEFSSLARAA